MSQVLDVLKRLVGKPVWGARRSHGSSFFIEIGSPHLSVREASTDPEVRRRSPALAKRKISLAGEFQILILDCNWAITSAGADVTNFCEESVIDGAVRTLNSTYIAGVDENDSFTLSMDSGVSLIVASNDDVGKEDQWNILVPEGETWALCPDGSVIK